MPHVTSQRRPRRSHAAALGAGAIVAALVLLAPLPASAHAALISSSPSDGDVVARVPTEVSFTFDEAVVAPAFVSVIGPDGSDIADRDAVIDGATVSQAVRLVSGQGQYTTSYRVVSDDGHPVTGSIHFTVDPSQGAGPSSSASAGCSGDGCADTSFWQRGSTWVVIAVAALAGATALVLAFGLRSGARDSNAGGDG